jgi:hypothetical protein
MPHIKSSVAAALKSEETVRACAVRQHVHEAMMLLATLPPSALEALREEFEVMARERTGPQGALKRAWVVYIQHAIDDAQLRERQGTFATADALGLGVEAASGTRRGSA